MSPELELELERAAAAATRHAGSGRQVAAVMPAEPQPGARVYLAAFQSASGLGYLAVDGAGDPVRDARLVRDAVSVIALAERAEEVSTLVDAEAVADRFDGLARDLEQADAAVAQAAREVARAAREVAALAGGVRLATPGYLDRVGEAAGSLGAALDAYAGEAERLARPAEGTDAPGELGEAAWAALAQAVATGDPASFGPSMAAATESVKALADDVVSNYLVPLLS
jgi:hypothetical protein